MILKASQRSGGRALAKHLMNGDENEHVTLHEVRGFMSETIEGALEEAYAVSRGTRCKQYLFSLSLNPPETENVSVDQFEAAIEKAEKRLGLAGQPRVVVFHEKNGRRHCHCAWSRINPERMTAINMSHFKMKLKDVSRELFLEHGWKMPTGIKKGNKGSRFNFTHQEWQQAIRIKEDPRALKAMFMGCWAQSDSKASFVRALEENGFYLARGDRRGFVAVDVQGETFSLTRWLDLGTRELKARCGNPESLPGIEQAKAFLEARVTEKATQILDAARRQAAERRAPVVQELRDMTLAHRAERRELEAAQRKRWEQETRSRARRLSRGVRGIFDRLNGIYQQTRKLNEQETKAGLLRDQQELHALVSRQLTERQGLQKTVLFYKQEHLDDVARFRKELARYISGKEPAEIIRPPEAKPSAPPVAEQIALLESRLSLLSGDISVLQASLESNLLSDEMRARIRAMIERVATGLQLKALETVREQLKSEERAAEIVKKQAELNDIIRQYAEARRRQEQEQQQWAANREFFAVIQNMGCSLNGVPLYKINMYEPVRLDEPAYVAGLRQQSNAALLATAFKPPPDKPAKPQPELAVPELRQSVLQVRELLSRAGLQPEQPPTADLGRRATFNARTTAAPSPGGRQ